MEIYTKLELGIGVYIGSFFETSDRHSSFEEFISYPTENIEKNSTVLNNIGSQQSKNKTSVFCLCSLKTFHMIQYAICQDLKNNLRTEKSKNTYSMKELKKNSSFEIINLDL